MFFRCLFLTAVCIWLLYQLKHSYDKKRIIEERNAKIPDRVVANHADIFKLGRKDLPNVGEVGTALETHHKEDENEEAEEEEHETKHETEFDERNGLLDDQFDEEPGHGEESSEEKDALIDETDSVDEEEHEGDVQEAREEHYKKDDASSAVHDDPQTIEPEFRNEGARSLDERMKDDASSAVHEDPQTIESEFRNEGARSLDEEKMINETVVDSKLTKTEAVDSKLSDTETKTEAVEGANGTSVEHHNQRELQGNNSTVSIELNTSAVLNNQSEIQSNSPEVDTVITSVPMQNETVKLDSVQDQNSTIKTEAGVVKLLEKSNTSEGLDAGLGGLVDAVQTEKSNTSEVGGAAQGLVDSIQTEKSNTSERGAADLIQMEKSNTSKNNVAAEGESIDPLQTEKPNPSEKVDVVQEESDDPSHSTITAEEKEARVDLSTLPDIEIKGTNTDYEAAE